MKVSISSRGIDYLEQAPTSLHSNLSISQPFFLPVRGTGKRRVCTRVYVGMLPDLVQVTCPRVN